MTPTETFNTMFIERVNRYQVARVLEKAILDTCETMEGFKLDVRLEKRLAKSLPEWHVRLDKRSGMWHLTFWQTTPGSKFSHNNRVEFLVGYRSKPEDHCIHQKAIAEYLGSFHGVPKWLDHVFRVRDEAPEWIANIQYHMEEIDKTLKKAAEYGVEGLLNEATGLSNRRW